MTAYVSYASNYAAYTILQIWSREPTTPTLWPSGALRLSGCRQHLTPKNLGGHVALTVLELLAFNAKSLGGHVTLASHVPFSKKF